VKIVYSFSDLKRMHDLILGAWKPYHSLLHILLDCHISLLCNLSFSEYPKELCKATQTQPAHTLRWNVSRYQWSYMNEKCSSIYSFTNCFTATPFFCQKEMSVSITILICKKIVLLCMYMSIWFTMLQDFSKKSSYALCAYMI
jgi:hypothetical protein